MTSMFDSVWSLVTPSILSKVTDQTGESEPSIVKAFAAAISAMDTMIVTRTSDGSFMNNLAHLAVSTATSSSSASSASDPTVAADFVSGLFGGNLSNVTERIARVAGIRESSATSTLTAAAPLVLACFGRTMQADNLTVADLADRLQATRAEFAAAMPVGAEAPAVSETASDTVDAVAYQTTHHITTPLRDKIEQWSFPIMVLLAVLCIGTPVWWAARGVADAPRPTVTPVVTTVVTSTVRPLGAVTHVLPGRVHLSVLPLSAEDVLCRYLAQHSAGGTAISLDRIAFHTGSAALTDASHAQIDGLATILRAYPKARVSVVSDRDTVGDEPANRSLSRLRAQALARALTNAGVGAERVRAEDIGRRRPITERATGTSGTENSHMTLVVSAG